MNLPKLYRDNKERTSILSFTDIIVVTVIMFGEAIYTSTVGYISILHETAAVEEFLEFSAGDNYRAILQQLLLLLAALGYLYFRHFDFSVWKIKPTLRGILKGILLFAASAVAMDIYSILAYEIVGMAALPMPRAIQKLAMQFQFSDVLYAVLNGFYEEIFFIGMLLSVKRNYVKWVIPFSLIIRFSFHTYQGMESALGIGFVFGGLLYIVYYKSREKDLYPFFVAHTIADIIGLSVMYYIFPI